jgi:hypothetical protein
MTRQFFYFSLPHPERCVTVIKYGNLNKPASGQVAGHPPAKGAANQTATGYEPSTFTNAATCFSSANAAATLTSAW